MYHRSKVIIIKFHSWYPTPFTLYTFPTTSDRVSLLKSPCCLWSRHFSSPSLFLCVSVSLTHKYFFSPPLLDTEIYFKFIIQWYHAYHFISFRTQFLSRVVISIYHCHCFPLFVLPALFSSLCEASYQWTCPNDPHLCCLWIILP